MGAMLYNPAIEQRIVMLDPDGMSYSPAPAGRKLNWPERGICLETLLSNGWQVVSVTPNGKGCVLVLERRVRDHEGIKGA